MQLNNTFLLCILLLIQVVSIKGMARQSLKNKATSATKTLLPLTNYLRTMSPKPIQSPIPHINTKLFNNTYTFNNLPKFQSPTMYKYYLQQMISRIIQEQFNQILLRSPYAKKAHYNIQEIKKLIIKHIFKNDILAYERWRNYSRGKLAVRVLDYMASDTVATTNLTNDEKKIYFELKNEYLQHIKPKNPADTSYDMNIKYQKYRARKQAQLKAQKNKLLQSKQLPQYP